jgi:hypothetical protein
MLGGRTHQRKPFLPSRESAKFVVYVAVHPSGTGPQPIAAFALRPSEAAVLRGFHSFPPTSGRPSPYGNGSCPELNSSEGALGTKVALFRDE